MSPPPRGQPCRGSRDNRQSATVSSTTCFSGAQFELATLHLSATHQVLNFTLRCNSDMLQKAAVFKEGVETLKDLKPGMILEGTVTNVAAFGAFVDVGVQG